MLGEIRRFSNISLGSEHDAITPAKKEEISSLTTVSPSNTSNETSPLRMPIDDVYAEAGSIIADSDRDIERGYEVEAELVIPRYSSVRLTDEEFLRDEELDAMYSDAALFPRRAKDMDAHDSLLKSVDSSLLEEEPSSRDTIPATQVLGFMHDDPVVTAHDRLTFSVEGEFDSIVIKHKHAASSPAPHINDHVEEQALTEIKVLRSAAKFVLEWIYVKFLVMLEDLGLYRRRLEKEQARLSWDCVSSCGLEAGFTSLNLHRIVVQSSI